MTKEELRGAVLRVALDAQNAGRTPTQTVDFLRALGLSGTDEDYVRVGNALNYLADNWFIEAKRIDTIDHNYPFHLVLRVTALGEDNVDGKSVDAAVVQNVQIIGSNYGQAVQHGTINVTVPAFPADLLRELLHGRPDALAAVDEIDREMKSDKPKVSKIAGNIEILTALASVPAAVTELVNWISRPEVQQFFTLHLAHP